MKIHASGDPTFSSAKSFYLYMESLLVAIIISDIRYIGIFLYVFELHSASERWLLACIPPP